MYGVLPQILLEYWACSKQISVTTSQSHILRSSDLSTYFIRRTARIFQQNLFVGQLSCRADPSDC